MLRFLPAPLLGAVMFTLLVVHTAFFATIIVLLAPIKFIMPIKAMRNGVGKLMISLGELWSTLNKYVLYKLLPPITWNADVPANLSRKNWYIIIANHQSWVDILVLFRVLNYQIPFPKYFLKQELVWVPFMGLALKALDFPFMKRYSKETLEKHPELKGKDLETTRKCCAKYKEMPVTVINFLEGTRFSAVKHERQQSPYQYLLKPKSGGLAFALSALGPQMDQVLDITIHYPQGSPSLWDFLSGRMRQVNVHIQTREIPASFFTRDYESDESFRTEFQTYIGEVWSEKDRLLADLNRTSLRVQTNA